ncbi:hypothetical protein [Deinococcus hopiensis]|uniref:Uncharacterized protein n=1 Tax=Deinococcus hopiensis KR-140 TaxID=695939 RepID=A0A1W1V7G3_9DEIO|nr:hypothetical protein [Deinococcus hopiensis]SMB89223.1 hypothetical protein SAMN00790413_00317 [Deinococcus hopiensis KR-140]
MLRSLLLALLLIGGTLALPLAALPLKPPQALYCTPTVYRDQVTPIGYQAVIWPAPGCTRPAKVRKENRRTGSVIGEPSTIPVGQIVRVWVFTHRLSYTLDGRTWQRLGVR